MKLHELKIKWEYGLMVSLGTKTFEIRRDDREYKEGDIIQFKVCDMDTNQLNDESLRARIFQSKLYKITYILRNCPEYGLKEGYCILAIKEMK